MYWVPEGQSENLPQSASLVPILGRFGIRPSKGPVGAVASTLVALTQVAKYPK
jgi:hypothetical protein